MRISIGPMRFQATKLRLPAGRPTGQHARIHEYGSGFSSIIRLQDESCNRNSRTLIALLFLHQCILVSLCSPYNTRVFLLHRVPKKLSRFVFVRTSSNFHKFRQFWQKDGKRSKYMRGALIFKFTVLSDL